MKEIAIFVSLYINNVTINFEKYCRDFILGVWRFLHAQTRWHSARSTSLQQYRRRIRKRHADSPASRHRHSESTAQQQRCHTCRTPFRHRKATDTARVFSTTIYRPRRRFAPTACRVRSTRIMPAFEPCAGVEDSLSPTADDHLPALTEGGRLRQPRRSRAAVAGIIEETQFACFRLPAGAKLLARSRCRARRCFRGRSQRESRRLVTKSDDPDDDQRLTRGYNIYKQ